MIVFKCIIFGIVFLWMIYRIGNLITRLTKSKNKLFNFLYGFITVFAVNQLILTPCILLHAPFQVAFSVTLVIDLLLVLLSFFRNDSNTIRFTKREMGLNILVGILVVGQMLLSTIIYKSNADDSFYVSLSTSSIDNEALYMEEPSMGYKAETSLLTITEQIPSLELQIGILSKISTISPAILCHSVLPMIIIFISYIAYYFFGRIFFNTKHAKLFLIILSIIFLFTGFSTRFRPGYLLLRAWQGKTIFLNIGLTMVIALLIRLDKKVTKKDILLLILSNIFSIAMSSTAIFIVAFAYIGFGVLKLLKLKWKDILYLIVSFIPVIIYVGIILLMATTGNGIQVPTEEVSIIESLKFYKNITYLIVYGIATIIIMFIGNKTAKRYFVYVQIINLLTIWNPLFSDFIAKYFTSSATFWRVLWLLPIEFAIAYCVVRIFEKVRNQKIKIAVLLVSLLVLIVPGKFMYTSATYIENLENIPQCIIDQTNYILEQDKDEESIMVLAPPEPFHNSTMRQLSSKIKLIYSRDFYLGKLQNEQMIQERRNLQQIYTHNFIYETEAFNQLLKKYAIRWVIIDKGDIYLENYLEKSTLKKDCEIEGYTLYKNSIE